MKLFRHLSAYLASIFDQPGGIPQLDSDGNLVGPIIFSEENEADILGRTGASGEVVRAADTGNLWAYDDTNGWVPAAPHATFNGTNVLLRTPADAWYKFAVTELEEAAVSADWFVACVHASGDAGDSWTEVRNGTSDADPNTIRTAYDGDLGDSLPNASAAFGDSYYIHRGVARFTGLEAAQATFSFWVSDGLGDCDTDSDTPVHLFPASNTYDYSLGAGTDLDAYKQLLTDYGNYTGEDVYYESTGETKTSSGTTHTKYQATIPASWVAADGTLTIGMLAHADAEDNASLVTTGVSDTINGINDGNDLSATVDGIVEAT